MTAHRTITVMATAATFAAALLGVWSYARAGDGTSLLTAILFAFAGVMGLVQLRRVGPSDSGSFNPSGAGRTIAKFVGFAGACWVLILVRARGAASPLIDPLNLLVLLASLCSLVLGLHFSLLLRDSTRAPRGSPEDGR